jgi:outer membrane protein assembly factor BamB
MFKQPVVSVRMRRRFGQGLGILGLLSLILGLTVWSGPQVEAQGSDSSQGTVFASSTQVPQLQYPEGITSWHGKVYVSTYNFVNQEDSRVLVFNANSGHLIRALGDQPGEELLRSPMLGLTIDPRTGDLFACSNFTGQILRIHRPGSGNPEVSVYAQYPPGGGPEFLAFNQFGTLYASDSNLGVVYTIPPGGGQLNLLIGPPGSGAPISDNGLFDSPVAGLSPNGITFGLDFHTFYAANTYHDRLIAFDVNAQGEVTGNARVFAEMHNPDLETYPTGFEGILEPDTEIGPSATTPINGPDDLAVDSLGRIWAASVFGDNVSVFDPQTGAVVRTFGSSAATQGGLLNAPTGMTFVGQTVFVTNLGLFTDGSNGNPLLPWSVVQFDAGVTGAGGNGNP